MRARHAAGRALDGGGLTMVLEGQRLLGPPASLGCHQLAVGPLGGAPPVAEARDGADRGQEQGPRQADAHQRRRRDCNRRGVGDDTKLRGNKPGEA